MQQIFGGRVALYSPQHNEVYEINVFCAEMFSLLFLVVTRFQCPIKALNVACSIGQWLFIILDTEVFKYNF